jgi:hypothetical protein
MLSLLIFVVVVGLLIWLCSLLPLPAPFQQVILVIGIIVVVIACLQFLFGIDILSHARSLR